MSTVIPHREPHELALLLPPMESQDLDSMAADIKQNGLQFPIVLLEEKILDGVQRQAACERANVYPQYLHFEHLPEWRRKAGPLAFVLSLNLHRRHLTTSQRQAIAAELADMKQGRPEKSSKTSIKSVSQPEAAKLMKVGRTGVQAATRLKREAPEAFEKVKAGNVTVSKAASEIENHSILHPKADRSHKPISELTDEQLWSKFSHWLNNNFNLNDRKEVKRRLVKLLSRKERTK